MTGAQTFRALLIVQFVLPLVSRLIGATHPGSSAALASHFAHPHVFEAVGLVLAISGLAVVVGLWCFQPWARIGAIIILSIAIGFAFYSLGVGFVGQGSFGMMYLQHFVTGALFAMMFLPPVSHEFDRRKV